MDQEYIDWNTLKYQLITSVSPPPQYGEREVWWCSIGKNVGVEIDGKNNLAERPVLIIRKFGPDLFFGLPLSSKQKTYSSRFPIVIGGIPNDIILNQGRAFSALRLNRRLITIGAKEFETIRKAFFAFV